MELTYILSPDELVRALDAKIRSADLEWESKIAPWTKQVKESLREIVTSQGIPGRDVLYSDTENDTHEFLLDLVVWDRSSGEGVTLAVESEWLQNPQEIEDDFWKLMVIKSPMKLLIFALNANARKHTQDLVWERLSGCLLKYRDHQKGERYIFLDYARLPARKAWWIEIPADGPLSAMPERRSIALEP